MNKLLPQLFFLFILWNTDLQAQVSHIMTQNSTLFSSSMTFYDDGGPISNVGINRLVATFIGVTPYIEVYFEEFSIPVDAKLNIYKGSSVDGELMASITDGHKPWNIKAKVITIEYIPSPTGQTAKGWKGIIKEGVESFMTKATAPESDCINAIPICSNSTINTSANQYDDTGAINDDSGGCYGGTGSGGSVWYQFSPQSNGLLDFSITPLGSTDYDFVLWDITNGCANKTEISCNWCAPTGPTGLSTSGSGNSQGSSGTNFNQRENVVTTKVYAICINYYSGTNGGFQLNFQNDPSSVSVIDNTPPTITNVYGNSCTSSTTLDIYFSEWMNCATLQASDFTIPGRTITLNTTNCSGGNPDKTNHIVINVSPALAGPATYTITGATVNDLCGNPLNDSYDIVFGVAPIANAGPDRVVCRSPGFLGIGYNYTNATLNGSGGTNQFWSTGQSGASISVSPHVQTTYTMIAQNGGCTDSDDVIVNVEDTPIPNLGPDQTICAGFPVNLNGTVGVAGVSYQWQSTTSTFFGSPTGWTNIAGATGPTLSQTPITNPTYYRVVVTSPGGCQGTDWARVNQGAGAFNINATKAFACAGESITLSVPGGISSYVWSTGVSANNPLTISPATTTTYSVTSTTVGCAGSASITLPVRPVQVVTATATPAMVCPGTPVNLSASPSTATTNITENFEGGTQSFTLVNGTYNNWRFGTAAFCSGAKGLYIGTAAANNNYEIGNLFSDRSATNHAYRNYTVTSYCNANLSFNWRNNGNANAALSVFVVPTSFTPVAGTVVAPSATQVLVGGPYFDGLACTNVNVDLTPYAGQTIRIVFQWRNTGGFLAPAVENTAAMIDDVIFTESTTYAYDWTSSPAGFSSTFQTPSASPVVNTTYNLQVTRCDGCVTSMNTDVTMCVLLPLELVNFTANCQSNNKASIYWQTNNEQEVDYFAIERSADGDLFQEVYRVDATGGLSGNHYNQNVLQTGTAHNYFRIKQVDLNGDEHYSQVNYLACDYDKINQLNIYPNPTNADVNISFNAGYETSLKISVIDVLGRTILQTTSEAALGINLIQLQTNTLAAAVYTIKIEDLSDNRSPKLFKLIKN